MNSLVRSHGQLAVTRIAGLRYSNTSEIIRRPLKEQRNVASAFRASALDQLVFPTLLLERSE